MYSSLLQCCVLRKIYGVKRSCKVIVYNESKKSHKLANKMCLTSSSAVSVLYRYAHNVKDNLGLPKLMK
jgi:hypothetical protein